MTNIRCDMKYPDNLSDRPPRYLSDEVTNIRCEMTYPDNLSDWNWNCQWQQINYWLSNVWSESPFKTAIFTAALHCVLHCIQLYKLSFGVELLDRSVIHLLLQKMLQLLSICSCCCCCFVVLMISYCCCCVVYIITHGQQPVELQQQLDWE